MTLLARFLHLVSFDTHSEEGNPACPSTPQQRELGQFLAKELAHIGLVDVIQDDWGYVYGTIPATADGYPTIGLIAHMDVSSDAPSAGIRPRLITNYDGGDIVLNEAGPIVLSPATFPSLHTHVGKTLIVTDGTTLLGADDKAGIAEILTAAERLIQSDLPHGPVRIAFTPDEEIGRGADHFDLERFTADWAYTVDGGGLGELEYENFNAASAVITFCGKNVHPGSAYGCMQNALKMAMDFHTLLPAGETPEQTREYEGFFHLHALTGSVESAVSSYLIRDHDPAAFCRRKEQLHLAASQIESQYGPGSVHLTVTDTYYNMRRQIEPHMHIIKQARAAMEKVGITPKIVPIRGGTDGVRLSYMGLPCPNLCTGGENFHGRFEYIPLEDMEKTAEFLVTLILDTPKRQVLYR